ncbi:MAG: thiamine diphosphokinase [Bacilli bacterium]
MNLYLIIGNNINLKKYHFSFGDIIVGIDKGAYLALQSGLQLNYAVGDFDSLSLSEFDSVKKTHSEIIQLNPIKDCTDTFYAYQKFEKNMDKIIILGGIQGKRIEHFIALLNLIKQDDRIELIDDYTSIKHLKSPYRYKLEKSDYRFISFFSLGNTILSLNGFKYALNKYSLSSLDSLCISNELVNLFGEVEINGDDCLMFQSKDDVDFSLLNS